MGYHEDPMIKILETKIAKLTGLKIIYLLKSIYTCMKLSV